MSPTVKAMGDWGSDQVGRIMREFPELTERSHSIMQDDQITYFETASGIVTVDDYEDSGFVRFEVNVELAHDTIRVYSGNDSAVAQRCALEALDGNAHDQAAIPASIYGGIVLSSVDGPGQRAVVHFAGCSIRCKGCFNTAIWSGVGRKVRRMPVAELARTILRVSRRVTISGGEPTDQPLALVALLRELRRAGCSDIVMFTGRRWESARPELHAIAHERLVDAVIDGPFEFDHAEDGQVTRGSTNQRIIHLTDRLTPADFAHRDVQVHLDLDGRTTVTGFPSRDLLVALRHGETDHG